MAASSEMAWGYTRQTISATGKDGKPAGYLVWSASSFILDRGLNWKPRGRVAGVAAMEEDIAWGERDTDLAHTWLCTADQARSTLVPDRLQCSWNILPFRIVPASNLVGCPDAGKKFSKRKLASENSEPTEGTC